jgi:phosphoribosylformimino-5-aminoimidazole carboxamide ribotide isomerase
MQIIPVLDLAGGIAVHARGGDRDQYVPVESKLAPTRPGDAAALLHAYAEELGSEEFYLADLDAIAGGPVQRNAIRELADFETGFAGAVMVDAGTSTPGGALEVLACGASQVVVGLETLQAFADLGAIVAAVHATRVVFSLDLRLGNPVMHPAMQDAHGATADPIALAAQAVGYGVSGLLVIDIGRVGTGCGVDHGLLDSLRRHFSGVRLLGGGGVLTRRDLDRMRDAGCDGALVASALHAGRITAADLEAFSAAPSRQSPTSTSR